MKRKVNVTCCAAASILVVWLLGSHPAPAAFALSAQSQPEQPASAQSSSTAGGQAGSPSEADANEYKNYRLNMSNVSKYVTATKSILKVMSENPTLRKQFESQRDVATIDAAVATTEKYPEVTAGIEGAGLTTRDYVVISGTLTGAIMAVDMRKQGQIKAYPTTILPENLTFVEKNYEKLKSIMKMLQADQDQE
jgi:hypothetical protein